jgi:hypothetical protein
MRNKWTIMLTASALLAGPVAAFAAEKPGKPLDIRPGIAKPANSKASATRPSDDWRERAMEAQAEFAPDGAPPRGRTRAIDERGERPDGEEAGGGQLREDRGEGRGPEE